MWSFSNTHNGQYKVGTHSDSRFRLTLRSEWRKRMCAIRMDELLCDPKPQGS